MGKRIADYLKDNSECVRTLAKAGVVAPTVIRNFQIFTYFSGLTDKSKMQKYEDTAQAMKVSNCAVRNAIREMNKNL